MKFSMQKLLTQILKSMSYEESLCDELISVFLVETIGLGNTSQKSCRMKEDTSLIVNVEHVKCMLIWRTVMSKCSHVC